MQTRRLESFYGHVWSPCEPSRCKQCALSGPVRTGTEVSQSAMIPHVTCRSLSDVCQAQISLRDVVGGELLTTRRYQARLGR